MKVTYTELPGKAEAGYGITRWANAQEINQSLKNLSLCVWSRLKALISKI